MNISDSPIAKASIKIFCLPEELTVWLQELVGTHKLAGLLCRIDNTPCQIADEPERLYVRSDTSRIFLMPLAECPRQAPTLGEAEPRRHGWLDVEPSRLVADAEGRPCLLYAIIVGEDYGHETVHPTRFVKWLKKRIKSQAKAGVIGKNIVSGAKAAYRQIWHTEKALQVLRTGGLWKQAPTWNVEYEPMEK